MALVACALLAPELRAQAAAREGLPLSVLERGDRIRLTLRDPVEDIPRATFGRWEGSRLVFRPGHASWRDEPVDRIRRLERWQPDPRNRDTVRHSAIFVGGVLGGITAITWYSFSPKTDDAAGVKAVLAGAAVGTVAGGVAGLTMHLFVADRGIWVRVRLP
jgi:hypothetical protein